jgi:hypothetical protein
MPFFWGILVVWNLVLWVDAQVFMFSFIYHRVLFLNSGLQGSSRGDTYKAGSDNEGKVVASST